MGVCAKDMRRIARNPGRAREFRYANRVQADCGGNYGGCRGYGHGFGGYRDPGYGYGFYLHWWPFRW